jgi:hypothetical protein
MSLTDPRGSHRAMRRGLRIDRLGTEVVVLDAEAALVHRLTGPAAEVVNTVVMRDVAVDDLPSRLAPAVAGLREAGVLRGDVPRRQALGAAVAGAVGILTVVLPAATAAASGGGGGGSVSTATDASTDGEIFGLINVSGYTYRQFLYDVNKPTQSFVVDGPPDGILYADVLIVGGGGAGGFYFGGGGGGGAVTWYQNTALAVSQSPMSISVGRGGLTNEQSASERQGGPSTMTGVSNLVVGNATVAGGSPGVFGAVEEPFTGGTGGATPIGDGPTEFEPPPGLLVRSAAASGGTGLASAGGGGAGAGGAGGNAPSDSNGGTGGDGFLIEGFFTVEQRYGAGGGGAGQTSGGAGGSTNAGGAGGVQSSSSAGGNGQSAGSGGGGGAGSTNPGAGAVGVVFVRYATP